MRNGTVLAVACAAILCVAGGSLGQIESHLPPDDMPEEMLPPWVENLPPYETHELRPPLREEVEARKEAMTDAFRGTAPAGPRLRRTARPAETLTEMQQKPRAVIRLAEAGRWKEAAEAAEKLFDERPAPPYGDFTWDYVANAAALAHIHLGRPEAAIDVHKSVQKRLQDPALRAFHRLEAEWLAKSEAAAAKLKQPGALASARRRAMDEELRAFEELADEVREAKTPAEAVDRLEAAYAKLRFVVTVQPSMRAELVRNHFRPAANSLVTDMFRRLETKANYIHKYLEEASKGIIRQRQWPAWNRKVTSLYLLVAEMKRCCRTQNYLGRVGLADSGRAEPRFHKANRLLFVQDQPGQVWQPLGRKRRFDTFTGRDVRMHVPYSETPVRPMDGSEAEG